MYYYVDGDVMNSLELSKIFSRMIEKTKVVSIETNLYYILKGLTIDKNEH